MSHVHQPHNTGREQLESPHPNHPPEKVMKFHNCKSSLIKGHTSEWIGQNMITGN